MMSSFRMLKYTLLRESKPQIKWTLQWILTNNPHSIALLIEWFPNSTAIYIYI